MANAHRSVVANAHPRRLLRGRPFWLRSIRGRLVASYLLAASVLASGGVLAFSVSLQHGLRANIDAGLHTRADAIAADVAAGKIDHVGPAPRIGAPTRAGEDVSTFTAILGPNGKLVDAQPSRLPAAPVVAPQTSAPSLVSRAFGGVPFRILTVPVHRTDGVWLVVAGQSVEAANETNTQIRRDLLIAIPVLLLLAGIGAWLLSGAALKPVDRMRADAHRLSERDGRGRITEPATRDGLNRLARTFNQLLDQLRDSLDQQRGLVADAGHELRTPLAVLRTELETAVRPNRTREDLVESIGHAQLEVARLAALADDLLLLAQADSGRQTIRAELTDISSLLADVAAAHGSLAEAKSISIDLTCAADLVAHVDPSALRRIADNLLANAIRHAPPNGRVQIVAESRPTSGGSTLVVRVLDDGPGFPEDFLPHAFDRFSRPDQGRSRADASTGTGLGLAVVRSLTLAHGGAVSAGNRDIGGAVVEVSIPTDRE